MKKNITQPLQDWDVLSVAILAMAKLHVKSIIYEERASEKTPPLLDYAPNTIEEIAESTA
jgi:hypothetical protein